MGFKDLSTGFFYLPEKLKLNNEKMDNIQDFFKKPMQVQIGTMGAPSRSEKICKNLQANARAMEAHTGAVTANPTGVEAQPRAVEARPIKVHPRERRFSLQYWRLKTHPKAMETQGLS